MQLRDCALINGREVPEYRLRADWRGMMKRREFVKTGTFAAGLIGARNTFAPLVNAESATQESIPALGARRLQRPGWARPLHSTVTPGLADYKGHSFGFGLAQLFGSQRPAFTAVQHLARLHGLLQNEGKEE